MNVHTRVDEGMYMYSVCVCVSGQSRQVAADPGEVVGGGRVGVETSQPSPNPYFSPVLTSPLQ